MRWSAETYRLRTPLLLMLVCFLSLNETVTSQEPGAALLESAISHRGDADIRTGEFHYELSVVEKLPTEEEIAARIEEIRSALNNSIEELEKGPGSVEHLRKALTRIDSEVPQQMRENASRTMRYRYLIGGPENDGVRQAQFSIFNREDERFSSASTLLQRSPRAEKSENLYYDTQTANHLVASSNSTYSGSQEPHRLGRAVGIVSELTNRDFPRLTDQTLLEMLSDVVVTPSDSEEDEAAVEVSMTIHIPDTAPFSAECRILPSKGSVTPLIREYYPDGSLSREWVSSNYFQPEGSELWFPRLCEYREFKEPGSQPRVETYTFEPAKVRLNIEIPDDQFRVDIPAGTVLIDAREAESKSYESTKAVSMSLEDLAQLDESGSFQPTAVIPQPPSEPVHSVSWIHTRRFLIIFNVGILLLIVWIFYRSRKAASKS